LFHFSFLFKFKIFERRPVRTGANRYRRPQVPPVFTVYRLVCTGTANPAQNLPARAAMTPHPALLRWPWALCIHQASSRASAHASSGIHRPSPTSSGSCSPSPQPREICLVVAPPGPPPSTRRTHIFSAASSDGPASNLYYGHARRAHADDPSSSRLSTHPATRLRPLRQWSALPRHQLHALIAVCSLHPSAVARVPLRRPIGARGRRR
jgi:hypothetical protein